MPPLTKTDFEKLVLSRTLSVDCKRTNPGVDKFPTTNGPVRITELGVVRFSITIVDAFFIAVLRKLK